MQFVGRKQKLGRFRLANTELTSILHEVADAHEVITQRQRIALSIGTRLTAEEALPMADPEITADFLKEKKIVAVNLIAANITVANLKSRGASIEMLRNEILFDSLDVAAHESLASQFATVFGREACAQVFLQTPSDAVALAGSFARERFGISAADLLRACNGLKDELITVLEQLGSRELAGMETNDLLSFGVTREHLAAAKVDLIHLSQTLRGSPEQVATLLNFKF